MMQVYTIVVPNTIAIAVGTAVASRSPHRSVREKLPHTAPPLGQTITSLLLVVATVSFQLIRSPAQSLVYR